MTRSGCIRPSPPRPPDRVVHVHVHIYTHTFTYTMCITHTRTHTRVSKSHLYFNALDYSSQLHTYKVEGRLYTGLSNNRRSSDTDMGGGSSYTWTSGSRVICKFEKCSFLLQLSYLGRNPWNPVDLDFTTTLHPNSPLKSAEFGSNFKFSRSFQNM